MPGSTALILLLSPAGSDPGPLQERLRAILGTRPLLEPLGANPEEWPERHAGSLILRTLDPAELEDTLDALQAHQPGPPVLAVLAQRDFELSRRCLRAGVVDLLLSEELDQLPDRADHLLAWHGQGRAGGGAAEQMRLMLDTMPEFLCYKDGAGRWLETNAFGMDLFRLTTGAFKGRTDMELAREQPELAPVYHACVLSDERAWNHGSMSRGEERIPVGDELLTFDVIKVPLFNPDGSRRGLVIIGRNISDRRKAEQALGDSENDLRLLSSVLANQGGDYTANVKQIIELTGALLDCDQVIHFRVSDQTLHAIGHWGQLAGPIPDKQLEGTLCAHLLDLQESDFLVLPDLQQSRWAQTDSVVRSLGSRTWLGHVIHDGRGTRIGTLCLHYRRPVELRPSKLSVLTLLARALESEEKRRESEEALRASEAHYREFFENDLTADFISTPAGVLLDCNPAFVRLFGFPSREEALASNVSVLFPDARMHEDMLEELTRTGKLEYREQTFRSQDGELLYTIVNLLGSVDDKGLLTGIRGFLFDISTHKELQQQFHQSQKMESIGRLAGGVAHDFNNLLTVINGHAELLAAQFPAGTPVRDAADQIGRAGDRAARLTRQLLAFSRRQVLQLAPVELNRIVGDMHRMLERLIGADVLLLTDLEPGLPCVLADQGQLEQVVVNLVVNSRDAMPAGGSLTISTRLADVDARFCHGHPPMLPGRYCLLEVQDTGQGMSEETRQRLFEPFFTTKPKGKGTGLGLATVYGIVKQVGGYIWVDSSPGQGARTRIYLRPISRQHTAVAPRTSAARNDQGGSETLLLVEDEPMVRELAARVLKDKGYRVLEAGNGLEALQVLDREREVQLVLTDMVMPRMGGAELARQLTQSRPELKLLFMTGHAEEPDRRLLKGPGTTVITKPFLRETLLRTVRTLLDGGT
ncbi:MAG: response regulator [Candidatus Delongbacteria bacterium]|nr:response regulator [Candidatus Delongbacteria bacterium]